jgi:hypothetical protein
MNESLDGRTCYLNVTRELSSYNVQVQASINGVSKSKTVNLGYHTTTPNEGQTVTPTPGQGTVSSGSVTFDFTKPSTLNPQVVIDDQHIEASIHDKVFTSGPVTLKFTDYGQGIVIKRNTNNNTYSMELRAYAGFAVSVTGNYILKEVSVGGDTGSIHEMSSSFRNWVASNSNTVYKEFKNGSEEAFMKSITVKYEPKL